MPNAKHPKVTAKPIGVFQGFTVYAELHKAKRTGKDRIWFQIRQDDPKGNWHTAMPELSSSVGCTVSELRSEWSIVCACPSGGPPVNQVMKPWQRRVGQPPKVTPAMEAGITDHVWSIGELIKLLPKATHV
jgi:hypothetical protein